MNDALQITFEALNLTDEFQDQWVDSRANRLSYYHHTGRQYYLGLRYKYEPSAQPSQGRGRQTRPWRQRNRPI